uniref:Major facilitator superfamily (MFS) profile domain-containing protein n=1 Tax=Panagrolaimus davidi TaxID=227884 RepID=A0A914QZB0_9BILA
MSAQNPYSNEYPMEDIPSEGIKKSEGKESGGKFIISHRFRYFILLLGLACLTSISSNLSALNFTFICMRKPLNETLFEISLSNKFSVPLKGDFMYTTNEKSALLWTAAIGSMIATFPFSFLYTQYGARYVFFIAGMISTFATLLVPIAANAGLYYFLALRFMLGIAYAADFAAIGVLCSRWASLKQNAIFLSFLTCFTPISSAITNPVSGILCESSYGWSAVYYVHGVASFILFLLWLHFYTDHPGKHQSVSTIEREKIHRDKSEAHINGDKYVPYWEIIKNPVILSVWLNAFVDLVSALFMLTYVPTYINSVLHFDVSKTGWLSALPGLSHIPPKLLCGQLSDRIKGNERVKLIVFNSIALIIPGIIFILVGHIPNEYPLVPVLFFATINAVIGANCGGFYKCGTLVSRQFSAFVIANTQFIKCISLFTGPILVSIFVHDESDKGQWMTIFYIFGICSFLANIVFCFMATDQPAAFTLLTKKEKNRT